MDLCPRDPDESFLLSANAPLPMIPIIFPCEPKDSETRQEYTAMDLGEWEEGGRTSRSAVREGGPLPQALRHSPSRALEAREVKLPFPDICGTDFGVKLERGGGGERLLRRFPLALAFGRTKIQPKRRERAAGLSVGVPAKDRKIHGIKESERFRATSTAQQEASTRDVMSYQRQILSRQRDAFALPDQRREEEESALSAESLKFCQLWQYESVEFGNRRAKGRESREAQVEREPKSSESRLLVEDKVEEDSKAQRQVVCCWEATGKRKMLSGLKRNRLWTEFMEDGGVQRLRAPQIACRFQAGLTHCTSRVDTWQKNAPDWDVGAWMGTAGVRSGFYRKVVGRSMWNWMAAFAAVDRRCLCLPSNFPIWGCGVSWERWPWSSDQAPLAAHHLTGGLHL
ncbi:hypothetical protein B0H14DRAFT_2618397 [Mycena olivaceomarginata]|nr:hypothetical protein B0H14DRAFT_2618397 [Mycena olivaceomarginata]